MATYLKQIVLIFAVLTASLTFINCSQTSPEITDVNHCLIFEYKDEVSKPDVRLSVFVDSNSNVNRYDRIKINCLQNKYIWDTKDLILIKETDNEAVGYNNFVLPAGQSFINGNYEVILFNADQKETKLGFNVQIDPSFYNYSAKQIRNEISKLSVIKQISIYNKQKQLIYYGENTDFNNSRDIWVRFNDAAYYYDMWLTKNKNLMIILPQTKVEPN